MGDDIFPFEGEYHPSRHIEVKLAVCCGGGSSEQVLVLTQEGQLPTSPVLRDNTAHKTACNFAKSVLGFDPEQWLKSGFYQVGYFDEFDPTVGTVLYGAMIHSPAPVVSNAQWTPLANLGDDRTLSLIAYSCNFKKI